MERSLTKETGTMAGNFDKFRKLLEELFQLDQADLDFGIYRIMGQKRDEIVSFLDKDLLPQVKEAFSHYQSADKAELQQQLDKLVASVKSAGMNPDDSPKVLDLRQQLDESSIDVEALEQEVFSHLFSFFRRYYHEGDFISLRRYKEGVYAIPYEGEEVKLHWANHDQYYIKSSEYFRDYTFIVASGNRVRVHLTAASTEQDNKKETAGKERRFIICAEDPVYEENGELYIRFEYRPHSGQKKQDKLNEEAIARVLASEGLEDWTKELGKPAPTEKNPKRTVLEKHLTKYTSRNTFDYFIHKDLGGFLRQELDFYIKNEVMHLDDIENDTAPRVEQYLSKVKVIRKIGHKVILFLEQLENFQKKLWLKKKFVVETNYCITLDKVPEELYPEIAANDAQREEWLELFAIEDIKQDLLQSGYSENIDSSFLETHQYLSINTAFYSNEFKQRLLSAIENIEGALNGVLIQSDNFHALSLASDRFKDSITTTYIDPPYNTGDDDFLYKDAYRHSSWLSMLACRLLQGRSLNRAQGTITISIDDSELHRLCELLHSQYGATELAKLVWDRNRKNDAKYFSVGHEYMVVFANNYHYLQESGIKFREPKEGILDAKKRFQALLKEYGNDWNKVRDGWLSWFDDIPVSDPRRRLKRYSKVSERGPYRDDRDISWPGGGGPRYEVLHPKTGKPCKVPSRGWVYPNPERFWEEVESGRVVFGEDHSTTPAIASYLFEGEGQVMPSVFYSYAQTASQEFNAMFGERAFDNPKNWRDLTRLFRYLASDKQSWILDYFAGSGTTAHAVIALNREDRGNRKFFLVEMGSYFDDVLLPRVRKAAYSSSWKSGKPIERDGSSLLIKYLRLESYDDTLNNLQLKRSSKQQLQLEINDAIREDYTLSYMLDVETRDSQSLLNIEGFRNPDEYKLKVERDGETVLVNIDLVETFNWLLGLTVKHIDRIRGIRVIEGTNPEGERVLVLWRNLDETDNDALDQWFTKQDYNTREQVYDLFYVNGDNNLENLCRTDQTWKVRLIEEEFQQLMFDVQDV